MWINSAVDTALNGIEASYVSFAPDTLLDHR